MRVWDIHPGYLSRTRLLGEHREIHAVWIVITKEKKGYAHHPEVERWRGRLSALSRRHELVVAEMTLRGYRHKSPLNGSETTIGTVMPPFVDPPQKQFGLLSNKYQGSEVGRIPLPRNGYEFWSHHKYSVMSRGYEKYKCVSQISKKEGGNQIQEASDLVNSIYHILLKPPSLTGLRNTWQHIIGYFRDDISRELCLEWNRLVFQNTSKLSETVYRYALDLKKEYILHSTILADLPPSKF